MTIPKLNWTIIVAAVIAILPSTIIAVASLYKAEKTHDLVNSRMTELLEMSKSAATAAATLREKEAEAAREASGEAAILRRKKPEATKVH